MTFSDNDLLRLAIEAAVSGGEKIMEVYNSAFAVEYKDDNSPLTLADKQAHDVIWNTLHPTAIPILSEEGKTIPYEQRKNWTRLWIVDPLDGTKEFIKRNGEFTVNIALVENSYPVMGVIYVPVTRELYFASRAGSFKCVVENSNLELALNTAQKLSPVPAKKGCRIVASRSHMSPETEQYIEEKKKQFGRVDLVSKGSSLKFCMVAESVADFYPRYAPTMEWDTAAGQAIVEFAGRRVTDVATGKRMHYNRKELLNNWFLVE
ncbi:MAG TPA: 3'(2'),5'-bisphosphate nucleotidase CysQ [Flavobacteriales bacterium]|nr:3'(2'),5'-bisphosphate nucleotidase CysQ [Flavobacteriales bacterium]